MVSALIHGQVALETIRGEYLVSILSSRKEQIALHPEIDTQKIKRNQARA